MGFHLSEMLPWKKSLRSGGYLLQKHMLPSQVRMPNQTCVPPKPVGFRSQARERAGKMKQRTMRDIGFQPLLAMPYRAERGPAEAEAPRECARKVGVTMPAFPFGFQ